MLKEKKIKSKLCLENRLEYKMMFILVYLFWLMLPSQHILIQNRSKNYWLFTSKACSFTRQYMHYQISQLRGFLHVCLYSIDNYQWLPLDKKKFRCRLIMLLKCFHFGNLKMNIIFWILAKETIINCIYFSRNCVFNLLWLP